jgi:dihydrofolate synthase/folylpolyglutamate synthase
MGTEKTIGYIYGLRGEPRPDQERFKALLSALGDPHRAFCSVHVAGTNGKGSTCAFLASILAAHGKKTGLYTSPYLERFNERMQIGGAPIGDDELTRAVERVRAAAEAIESAHGAIRPYEAITAAAFWWFARNGVETAVIETGLGGAGDATNVLCPSHVAITSISHDHTRRLGSRIEDIAREKAGIIKRGAFVAVHPQEKTVEDVLMGRVGQTGCRAHFIRPHDVAVVEDSMRRRAFDLICGPSALCGIEVPLLGRHQMDNAASAACIALDMGVPAEAIRLGIRRVRWPGRMELVCGEQGCAVIDGAHNPAGARALAQSLERYFAGVPKVLLCAVSANKDAAAMARIWAKAFDGVVATTCPRLMPAAETGRHFAAAGARVTVCEDARQAFFTAREQRGALAVVAGSIYLAGAMRTLLRQAPGPAH